MALSSSVINKFVEVTQSPETSTGYYSYGTAIVNGDDKYVQLDGAESVTSISVATDVATGDRVLLYIENHTATVVGNITCPASGRTAISVSQDLLDFETIAVGRLDAVQADIEEVYANYVSTMYLFADYVTANYILAETVAANYATIGELTALHEYVDSLEASEITVEYLEANYANIASLVAVEEYVTQLAAEMITTDYLKANYATIEDLDVTNINVTTLSSDYANINSLLAGNAGVGDLQAIYLTADNVVIDSAVMETIFASNAIVNDLTAGTIYTARVRIQTDEGDTSLYLGDSLIQMSEGDLVRLQAGKDATGEYGFYIWNAEGKIMFDATGATSDGIGSEVIVNTHVADNANISGYKLDIASVAERLNEDGSLTIEAAQVTINGSTLDAWYAEVTETTTELGTSMSVLETQFTVVQGQVDTVVSQTEILEGEVTSLSDQYAEIVVNVDSITTQVKDLSSDYDTLTGEYTNLTSQVASITTNVNNITIEVNSLTEDYSGLTSQMSSITTDVSSITSSVSSIESQLSSIADSVSEESIIEILKNNITLKTSSSTNGTASIILSVDGEDAGDATVVTDAREAFQNESSSITISAGTVTFNSGTLIINSGNFTLDSGGNVTMNKAYATNLTVTGDSSFYGILTATEIHLVDTNAFMKFGSAITDPEWNGITPIEIGYDTGSEGDIYSYLWIGNTGIGFETYQIKSYGSDGYPTVGDYQFSIDMEPMEGMSMCLTTKSSSSTPTLTVRGIGSGVITIRNNETSDTMIKAICEWAGGTTIEFGVGSGGYNRGIYDYTGGGWLVYADSNNKCHLGASTVGSSTKPIYLSSGVPTACTLSNMVKVSSISEDNISFSSYTDVTISSSLSGYTPIGVVGWSIANGSTNGANSSYCYLGKLYNSSTTVTARIRTTSSSTAIVKITLYVLYIASS